MTATTDGRRRRGFALALLVALTALLLAPAVVFAPAAQAAQTIPSVPSGYTRFQAENTSVCTGGQYLWEAPQTGGGTATYREIFGTTESWPAKPINCTVTVAAGGTIRVWGASSYPDYPANGCFNDPAPRVKLDGGSWGAGSGGDPNYSDCRGYLIHETAPLSAGAHTLSVGTSSAYTMMIDFLDVGLPPDTEAPTAPTVTLTAAGSDVAIGWSGATDNVGVTGYRYRDNGGAWTTWSAPVLAVAVNRYVAHTVDVQARDAAGNWSTSGSASWLGCTTEDTSGCDPVTAPGGGALYGNGDAPSCVGAGTDWHCLWWGQPLPDRPVHQATFVVEDYGVNRTHTIAPIVGWRCFDTGEQVSIDITPGNAHSEGVAYFRGGSQRSFTVDCGSEWIGAFYVLGGTREDTGEWANPDPADWNHVTLWWSYGVPEQVDPPDVTGSPQPIPSRTAPAPTPAPTVVYPDDPGDSTATPDGDCDFGITDPSSWLCGLTGLLGRLIGVVQSILTILRDLGGFLLGLFVPDSGVFEANVAEVRTAYDDSALGTISGAVGDIASPITGLESTVTSCEGAPITIPLDGDDVTFYPLSTCHEFVQTTLGWVMPIWKAFLYLGTILLAGRILGRAFGVETPGSEARPA